jgi:hypothetical protein
LPAALAKAAWRSPSSTNTWHSLIRIHKAAHSRFIARLDIGVARLDQPEDADKSQLAMAESPTSDRIAFALCPLETGLRMCPAEKSRAVTPFSVEQFVLCSPVC